MLNSPQILPEALLGGRCYQVGGKELEQGGQGPALKGLLLGMRVGPWGQPTGKEVNIPELDTEKWQQAGMLGRGPRSLQGT